MAAAAASAWKRFALSLFLSLFFRKTLQMFLFGERENEKISSQRCIIEIGTLSLAFSLVWSSNNFSSTQLEIKDTMEVRERERDRDRENETECTWDRERKCVDVRRWKERERERERDSSTNWRFSISQLSLQFCSQKMKTTIWWEREIACGSL